MNKFDKITFASIAMLLLYGIAWVGTGTLAWNWVEPDSFFGALLFLIVWGILGYLAQLLAGLILGALAIRKD